MQRIMETFRTFMSSGIVVFVFFSFWKCENVQIFLNEIICQNTSLTLPYSV